MDINTTPEIPIQPQLLPAPPHNHKKYIIMIGMLLFLILAVIGVSYLGLQNQKTAYPDYDTNTIPSIKPQSSIFLFPTNAPITPQSTITQKVLQTDTTIIPSNSLEYSDGSCSLTENNCKKVNYGCGAVVCTNNPEKYKDMVSICLQIPNHPSFNGYRCDCILELSKCGWVN